ncbi:hypothetical protein MMC30_004255 [Trapelia coarctata]|nr:hypothetical protein [Trapelia coarctata]
MQPPLPSATPTWHNDTYPALSPSRPEVSVAGKTIIITGAGSGIGRETAIAFATAGAKQLILLGRNDTTLTETKDQLPPNTASCSIHAISVTDEEGLKKVAASAGTWDILVLNAGFISSPASVSQSTADEWWQSFETNVKGVMVTTQAFLRTANPTHAAILGVTTGASCLPPAMLPGLSAYISSKLAQVKLLEFLAVENPNIFVASLHPGMVDTDMFRKSGGQAEVMPMDKVQLPAHFLVWLASPEAAFLKGRLLWANWDVEELKSQAEEIKSEQKMTAGIIGWPYPHMG